MRPHSVPRKEALEVTETPYGLVGLLHAGTNLKAWWIWKEQEDVDPEWSVMTRDDFLLVVRGQLRLELRNGPQHVLGEGESFVIPAGTGFRGYRWPRESSDPCLFVAVSAGDVETTRAPVA